MSYVKEGKDSLPGVFIVSSFKSTHSGVLGVEVLRSNFSGITVAKYRSMGIDVE